MRYIKYLVVFLLGFLIAKFWYEAKEETNQKEQIQVVVNGIKNQSKLVISKGVFSEIYNYQDSKKYFFESISFDKKAIIAVNATVEVGYDLSKLEIQIDSIGKKIIINKIPAPEINISPDIKYFDLQQSNFNTFSKDDLNRINKKSIEKIKQGVEFTNLKREATTRLFEELSKIYQLSSVFNWEVVNNTGIQIPSNISLIKD
jgi:hypothetical protein